MWEGAKKQCVVAVCALLTTASVYASNIEVLHWWTSGGEAKSVAELKKMLEAKGHKWKDFAVVGGAGENALVVLKSRVVSGNAPVAAQIKGPGIQEWAAEGVLANIDATAKAGNWDGLLPPVVSNVMKYKGNYVAAPVNVHRVNWMWVNPEVFKKSGADLPRTWDEFEKAADKIQKAGFIPLAHGGQPWQDFTLFESVALGVGGAEFYKKAFVELDPATLNSPTMVKAFETFGRMHKYIDGASPNRDWNPTTAMVINGRAAVQFMGDWAKGEFTAAGKVPGRDYLCLAAPGTENAFTFNVDSFAFFKQRSPELQKAQADLAGSIMSPQFQEIFNLNKGSIPARLNMSMTKFDDCAKKSSADFVASSTAGTLLPSIAHQMAVPPAAQGAIQDVVSQFFKGSFTARQAAEKLVVAAKTK